MADKNINTTKADDLSNLTVLQRRQQELGCSGCENPLQSRLEIDTGLCYYCAFTRTRAHLCWGCVPTVKFPSPNNCLHPAEGQTLPYCLECHIEFISTRSPIVVCEARRTALGVLRDPASRKEQLQFKNRKRKTSLKAQKKIIKRL